MMGLNYCLVCNTAAMMDSKNGVTCGEEKCAQDLVSVIVNLKTKIEQKGTSQDPEVILDEIIDRLCELGENMELEKLSPGFAEKIANLIEYAEHSWPLIG